MSVSDIRRLATRFLARAALPASRPLDPESGPREDARGRQGFTLVEMMVVVVIIGLLATVVAINVLPSQDRAMVTKAKADIATLEQAIETYRLDNLDFPADLQALVAAPPGLASPDRYRPGGYVRRLPQDPWGQPYQYRRQSTRGGQFDVFSYGADRKEGGEGNDADLGNWED
ncbi:type II secretion system major pseudopilin GspG [Brevundimonas sp.]|uniref:type II secretion system major pseudopilin GspG n=1 Tax=Brevundimonas sp. TaxID=1871086 RepID=UPI002627DC1B|nr:type II secretion system major pseudopilin GspG [Brevundimonas sp.]